MEVRKMKIRILQLVAGLLVCTTTAVHAGSDWGIFGSFWSPSDGEDSFGGGIKLGIEMVDRVQLDVKATIFSDVLDGEAGTAELEVVPIEAGLTFSAPVSDAADAYFGAGLGYYMMDGEVDGMDANVDDEVDFYLNAGMEWTIHESDADYGQTSVKLFLEGIYRFVEADNIVPTDDPAVLADADLNGLGVQFGMLIGW